MTATEATPVIRGNDIILAMTSDDLDLAATLDCGQAFRWRMQADGSYKGVARDRLLHIARMGDEILMHDTTMDDYTEIWHDYFDLGRNYMVLKEQFSCNPVLEDAIGYASGIRVLRQDPWETICTFIISANNNIPRIRSIVERMSTLFGEHISGDYYTFPTAQRMSELSADDLAPLRCGYRDRFLLDAAQKVAGGELSLCDVTALNTDDARRALMTVNGIGPKVADCSLLFGFGRSECFPMDRWMKKVMTVLYPTGLPEDILPYAGIAQQYLFHYARHHSELFE